MNRKMRRLAARQKPYEVKRVDLPRYLDEFAIFSDWERVLEKIEHGELEHANGKAVMMMSNGEVTEIVPAANAWCSAWKRFDKQFNLNHDCSALVRIVNCLHYGSPISESLFRSAKAVLAEERRLFRKIPRDQIASSARTEQIKLYMEAA